MSSSSASIEKSSFEFYPLITPKIHEQKNKDWVKIGAIVAAVIGGLTAALAILCLLNILPSDLLGGPFGTGVTLIVGAAILLPAGYVLFDRWRNPPQPS
jgi:hypothetical protein